jgi:hypothetical protein
MLLQLLEAFRRLWLGFVDAVHLDATIKSISIMSYMAANSHREGNTYWHEDVTCRSQFLHRVSAIWPEVGVQNLPCAAHKRGLSLPIVSVRVQGKFQKVMSCSKPQALTFKASSQQRTQNSLNIVSTR